MRSRITRSPCAQRGSYVGCQGGDYAVAQRRREYHQLFNPQTIHALLQHSVRRWRVIKIFQGSFLKLVNEQSKQIANITLRGFAEIQAKAIAIPLSRSRA